MSGGSIAPEVTLATLSAEQLGDLQRQIARLQASRAATTTAASATQQPSAVEPAVPGCDVMGLAEYARTSREDEVRYRVDPTIWDLPQFSEIPFDQLVNDYLLWLETRTERGGPAADATIKAARATLKSFRKALVADSEPLVAASISARSYDSWVRHLLSADLPYGQIKLRNGKLIDHPCAANPQPMSVAKIAQHTAAIKAFSNLYLYKIMEYTRADPLHRVEPYNPRPKQGAGPTKSKEPKEFSAAEVEALMTCHDTDTLLGKRDRAMVALVLATGLRISAASELPYADYEPVTGVIDTVDKRRRRLAHINGT